MVLREQAFQLVVCVSAALRTNHGTLAHHLRTCTSHQMAATLNPSSVVTTSLSCLGFQQHMLVTPAATHPSTSILGFTTAGERSPVRWYDFEGEWAWADADIGIGKLTVNGMKQVCPTCLSIAQPGGSDRGRSLQTGVPRQRVSCIACLHRGCLV